MKQNLSFSPGVEVLGRITPEYADILTPQALAFLAELSRRFEPRRRELMAARALRQAAGFSARDRAHPKRKLDRGAVSGGPPGSPRRDYGSHGPQDGDQCAEFG